MRRVQSMLERWLFLAGVFFFFFFLQINVKDLYGSVVHNKLIENPVSYMDIGSCIISWGYNVSSQA